MGKTSIEWCDESLNPLRTRIDGRVGHHCEKISPGCKHCYASGLQRRFGLPQFQHRTDVDREDFVDVKTLREPLKRRASTKFFWCDMSDIFGEWVPLEWIAACYGVMAATPRHVHQVLTKRPAQALRFYAWATSQTAYGGGIRRAAEVCGYYARTLGVPIPTAEPAHMQKYGGTPLVLEDVPWPLSSVWLGVSVENRDELGRVDILRQIPAAVRFLSVEPLLEDLGDIDLTGIHQVIVGGESGPKARPFDVAWARSIRGQCRAQGVAYFCKQLGANVLDRNDAGFDGDGGDDWDAEVEFFDGPGADYQGAPARVHLKHSKGGAMEEWPEDLRIREWPEVHGG